jgi:hypothetical protein
MRYMIPLHLVWPMAVAEFLSLVYSFWGEFGLSEQKRELV